MVSPSSSKTMERMRRRLKRREKEMPRARGRIASERVADFSQVLSPRVAAHRLRRAGTSKVWGACRDASPTAVYVTGAYGPVAHAQAARVACVAAKNDESERTRPHCVVPSLKARIPRYKRGRANWQSHARNDDHIRKQSLCVPMGHFPSFCHLHDMTARMFSIAVSRSAASVN